jgi:hypothetical protein
MLLEVTIFELLCSFDSVQPGRAVLRVLLDSGLQLGLVQVEVVYGADAHDAHAWKTRADAPHECAARGAEVVGHGVAGRDGLRLAIRGQVVATANILEIFILEDEVGREHGCGELVTCLYASATALHNIWGYGTVCARAHECVD